VVLETNVVRVVIAGVGIDVVRMILGFRVRLVSGVSFRVLRIGLNVVVGLRVVKRVVVDLRVVERVVVVLRVVERVLHNENYFFYVKKYNFPIKTLKTREVSNDFKNLRSK
jgi:hypothetical protein